ncbi:MAG: sulfatase-like hydrolase/transferase [Myxococcota bacterium]
MPPRTLLALALLAAACDDPAPAPAPPAPEPAPEPVPEPQAPAAPEGVTPPSAGTPTRVHLDLVDLAHLADHVVGGALRIPFGGPARAKYTSGGWNGGWSGDAIVEGEGVSRFGRLGRVYFPLDASDAAGALELRLRVRSVGAEAMLVFLNGETLPEQPVPAGGFRELRVPVPAGVARAGENYLLLRATSTRDVEGTPVSFEVARVDVLPTGATPPAEAAPLRGRATVAGAERDALLFDAPARASWVVEVPPDGALRFAASAASGAPTLRIDATPEGGPRRTLHEGPPGEARIALAELAGELIRLDVRAEGDGRLALGPLRVEVPAPALADFTPAKNVIVLLIDTLRASKLRPYEPRSRVRTPALDAFAREATLFERAQAPENWTKPSVASILTGLFPATHGTKNDGSKLPEAALTLGEVFQRAGFQTSSFLANGYVSRAFGFDQGWDHYTNYIRERRNTNASNVFREARAWIDEHADEGRFFTYIQTIDPHVPYDPPDRFLAMYDADDYEGQVTNRRTHLLLEDAKKRPPRVTFTERDKQRIEALHDGEISYHDAEMGKFLEWLDERGLADDTLFVITSDHGEEFEEHGSWGHGHSIFQELLHVPLLMRFPGVADAGRRVPHVVSTQAIAPTVLEAAGVPVPEAFEIDSLLGFTRGAPPPGPWLAFSDFQENRRVVRALDWKLVLRSSLTYVLFDLGRDPGERNEMNGRAHPIAMRYLRVMSGQFLGARDRRDWLHGGDGVGRALAENADIDEETCRQLVAIGYFECLELFPGAI